MAIEPTDEEIVKALENNLGFGIEHSGIYRICFAATNLINRLQNDVSRWKSKAEHIEEVYDADREHFIKTTTEQKTEIERLTEELDLANETIDRNNKRYERVSIERQKALDRVDCLEDALLDKIRRNEELITAIKQAEQQAVKDTAKEILDMLYTAMPKTNIVVEIKKRYGVEVE